jgi:4-amino-4-deoxy-L-arabinose transferase-like glycosyltransferase
VCYPRIAMSLEAPRRRALWLLALCFALRIVSLFRPCMSDDEATYCVVGREMLTGHALYRDIVDHKPPAIYVVNEAMQAIGGLIGGQIALHVLLILVVWGTALVLAAIARRVADTDARGPPFAALLYVVFTTTLVDTDSLAANCELFMMLPLAASVYVILGARGRPLQLALAGVLVGVAMLFKYQAGIQLPLYGIALIVWHRKQLAVLALGAVALAAGVAVPIALAIAWLVHLQAWPWAWFWFRFNFSYLDAGGKLAMAAQMALRVGFVAIAAAPLYALAVVAIAKRRHAFLIGWLAVSVLAVLVGGRFFGHYFHQITAPLAVIAAPAAVRFWDRTRAGFIVALALPAAIFLGLAIAHDPLMRAAGEPDPDYASVVAWLDHEAPRGEALCIWGNSPVLYFDADRPLGCRFVFANYLTGLSPATPTQTDPAADSKKNIVPVAWDMLEEDLRVRRPLFIVDGSPGNVGFYAKYPPEAFPRLAKILTCNYRDAALVAGMRIWKRRLAPRCP